MMIISLRLAQAVFFVLISTMFLPACQANKAEQNYREVHDNITIKWYDLYRSPNSDPSDCRLIRYNNVNYYCEKAERPAWYRYSVSKLDVFETHEPSYNIQGEASCDTFCFGQDPNKIIAADFLHESFGAPLSLALIAIGNRLIGVVYAGGTKHDAKLYIFFQGNLSESTRSSVIEKLTLAMKEK